MEIWLDVSLLRISNILFENRSYMIEVNLSMINDSMITDFYHKIKQNYSITETPALSNFQCHCSGQFSINLIILCLTTDITVTLKEEKKSPNQILSFPI